MIIQGNLGEYDVRWFTFAYSTAKIALRIKKEHKFLGIKWTTYTTIWTSYGTTESGTRKCVTSKYDAERYSPSQIKSWFQSAVEEYENHKIQWSNSDQDSTFYK